MRGLFAVALLACSNGPTATAPKTIATETKPAKADAPKGRVEAKRFESASLGVAKDVVVYLPAGYDAAAQKRWPVFYYLHGLGGDETNWTERGKLAAMADTHGVAAIIIMPDGDNSFYANSKAPLDFDACMKDGTGLFIPTASKRKTCVKKPDYETYVTKDLVAWVDATYRTIATREGRAIAGLSMGGFGALVLSMRHPELFAAAASHSGVDALMYKGPFPYVTGAKVELETDTKGWGGSLGPFGGWMRGIFGTELAYWHAHDPAVLVQKVEPDRPALYLDCGTEDDFALHNGAQYIHDLLLARKIDHAWYLGPGRHDFAFWTPRLEHSFAFLAKHVTPAR